MPTLLLAPERAPAGGPVAAADRVDVRVDELIVGRPLEFPISDSHDGLLLEKGRTVTAEFKRGLKQRGVCAVRLHSADAERLRFRADLWSAKDAAALNSRIATQLDRVIESGLLLVQNSGQSLKGRAAVHGVQPYNPDHRAALVCQRQAAIASLQELIHDAVRGNALNSAPVAQVAEKCLADLMRDADCLLSVVMESPRDEALADHCLKMAALGMAIALEMGLDEANCRQVGLAGLIHDWGMAKAPADILNAPRLLTEQEFLQIRRHPIDTVEMLERMPGLPSTVPIVVYQVHERPNGLGYPRGRIGDRIHPFARILAVADTYAALVADRPHRGPLSAYAAMECLIHLAKSRDLDPEAVRALLKVLTLFPIGSLVALDDGSVARVHRRNGDQYTTPIVQMVQDAAGRPFAPDRQENPLVDLARSSRTAVQALPTPGQNEITLYEGVLYPVRPKKTSQT